MAGVMFDSFHLSCFLRSSVNWLADISLCSMKLTARDKVNDQLIEYLRKTWKYQITTWLTCRGYVGEKWSPQSRRVGEVWCLTNLKNSLLNGINQYKILISSKQFFKAMQLESMHWVWPRKVNYQWLVYKVDKGHPIISNHRCRSRPISDSLQKFGLIYPGTRLPFPPFPSPLPP